MLIEVCNTNITMLRNDTDSIGVAEEAVCDLALPNPTISVSHPLAGHVCDCPVLLDEVLNDLVFVLEQRVNNLGNVKF
jgi:hypothetical protein